MQFFDAEGRIGIARFLLAMLLAPALLFGCLAGLFWLPVTTYPAIGAVAGLILLAWGCEAARRLHDLGITAWMLVIVAPPLPFVALAILLRYWVDTTAWIIGGGTVALCALLFLRPGKRAANRFGAPPLQILSRGAGTASRLRPLLALCLACSAGAGIGYLLYTISEGMREQAEWRTRMTLTAPDTTLASNPEQRV
jgi:uncharacterized membrane protein YhaH (DUF805 family)